MDTALFLSLIGFAFVSSITPGPNNLLLMSSGALFGWRRTLPHLGGILLGFAVVMTAAVFGLGSLVFRWPWLITAVRVLGAAWLLWLSLRYFRSALKNTDPASRIETAPISRPFRFFEAVFFQWINPKALIACLSAAGAYIAIAEQAWQRAVIMGGVFFVAGLIACTSWMVAGDVLRRLMSEGSSAKWANAGMGVLIVLTAGLVLFG